MVNTKREREGMNISPINLKITIIILDPKLPGAVRYEKKNEEGCDGFIKIFCG